MPKLKTCKTAAKRYEITGTGKIRHGHTGMNHLKMRKSNATKRVLSIKAGVTSAQRKTIRRQVPNL